MINELEFYLVETQVVARFCRQHSISESVRKYRISNISIYKWEKVIEESGISVFSKK